MMTEVVIVAALSLIAVFVWMLAHAAKATAPAVEDVIEDVKTDTVGVVTDIKNEATTVATDIAKDATKL